MSDIKKKKTLEQEKKILDTIGRVRKLLAENNPEDNIAEIDAWENKAKTALIKLSLDGHEGIEYLRKAIEEEVKLILPRLREKSDTLPDRDRDMLISKIEVYEWFHEFFAGARHDLADVKYNVDLQLQDKEEE